MGYIHKNRTENPLTAICLVGAARTLTIPRVYRSIKDNLIDSLSANTVTFAHLKLSDAPVKKQTKFGYFRRINASEVELKVPLEYIKPHQVVTYQGENDDRLLNPKCPLSREWGIKHRRDTFFTGDNEVRLVGQLHAMYECYKSVLDYEKVSGVKFDAVTKIRPDTVWLFPSYTAKELLLREKGEMVSHFLDLFIFAPRKYSDGFQMFYEKYIGCTSGLWKWAYTPEEAYEYPFIRSLRSHYYNDRKIPVVIRRANRNESSAREQCEKQRRIGVEECMDIVYSDHVAKQSV